jgi:hypothetical protein
MDFFIKEENVRPGNRGGRDQFKWDNVRLMNNKERESYLGVTQSIGFLDKGGKWRRRDWWLHEPEKGDPEENLRREREEIRRKEEQQWQEALNPGKNKTKPSQPQAPGQNKLTDYEWKELMKKEGNIAPDDNKLYEFYQNDEKKAGLGMKQAYSFRTNPYENSKDLVRLEGNIKNDKQNLLVNEEEDDLGLEVELEDNPYLKESSSKPKSIVNKYVKEYLQEIKNFKKTENNEKKKKKKHKSRSRSKDKDRKKAKSRSKSRSRSRHKSRKDKKEKKDKY